MKAICAAAALTITMVNSQANAQEEAPLLKSGVWTVYRSVSPMTDKVDCVARYEGSARYAVRVDSFVIDMQGRGGVQSYRVRFDDDKASDLIITLRPEREIGVAIFSDANFDAAKSSHRLRVETDTMLGKELYDDIDLTGLNDVFQTFYSKECGGG